MARVERRLYLVRHGECDNVTADGRLFSHAPLPLTARGREQARALGERFAEVDAPVVHASDLRRAVETAEGLAGGRPVVTHPGLREIGLGELDGAPAREVFRICPGWLRDPEAAPPGGESVIDVAARAGAAVDEIVAGAPRRDAVVVAHGGVNRAVLGRLLGLPLLAALRLRQDWACVNVLDRAGGRWWAGTLNWTPWGIGELARTRAVAGLQDAEWRRLGR
jgi:broad specificity phosphatase PhoE